MSDVIGVLSDWLEIVGLALNSEKIKFVLVETSSGGNIGAAARAMKTMGLAQLALVNPCEFRTYECYSRASGAYDLLDNALVCQTLEEAVSDCSVVVGTSARLRSLSWPQIEPHDFTPLLGGLAPEAKVAVVFGRERSGLSNAELALCSQLVVIPSVADFSSLNISAAVQVLAYEVRRAVLAHKVQDNAPDKAPARVAPGDKPATHEELEHMYSHLESTMLDTGYLDPDNPRMMMPRFRRLFNRAGLNRSEVQMLRGLFASLQKLSKRIKAG